MRFHLRRLCRYIYRRCFICVYGRSWAKAETSVTYLILHIFVEKEPELKPTGWKRLGDCVILRNVLMCCWNVQK